MMGVAENFSTQATGGRRHAVATALAATGLVALLVTVLPAPAATAAKAPAVPSAAGTYTITENPGGSTVDLTLNANGTSVYGSSCRGLWIQQGKTIAFDVNETCSGATYAFSGTVGPKGLSSAKKPGELIFHFDGRNRFYGWYAVKTGSAAAPGRGRTVEGAPFSAARPKAKTSGDYGYYDGSGQSNDPLTLNSDGSAVLTLSGGTCTGLWVQSGKDIAWDWNNAPFCDDTVFVGTVSSKGLSSAATPGLGLQAAPQAMRTVTWYAVR
jgi:hypothetical protein